MDDAATAGAYRPRDGTAGVLHGVVRELRRVFEIDVLACPRCGGRMRVLATLEDPDVVQKILHHVGLPAEPIVPHPPPAPSGTFW